MGGAPVDGKSRSERRVVPDGRFQRGLKSQEAGVDRFGFRSVHGDVIEQVAQVSTMVPLSTKAPMLT